VPLVGVSRVVLLLVLVNLLSTPVSLSAPAPAPDSVVPEYQLLTNPGVEVYNAPYTQYQGVNCQVASGWQRFSSADPAPYWMDTRVFAYSHLGADWVDRIEGATSQLLLATEPYIAGIRQTAAGLTPGVGYGFHAAMLTIYQTSAQPPVNHTMTKQVGIDPTGGTDPDAPTVVWSEADDHDQGPWSLDLRTAVYAENSTMTVFARVISPYGAGPLPYLNLSFVDSAILARTPVVEASSPAINLDPTFTVSWENAIPAPGGQIKWFDVQWMDEEEGRWHGWFTQTTEVMSSYSGELGASYRFRARAWQEYDNGAHLYGPYRPEGDTRTEIPTSRLAGWVLDNRGDPAGGATVAISGTAYATTSGSGGWYEMDVMDWTDPRTVTVSAPHRLAPQPVHDVTCGPTETVTITWTLRPPDDGVANGEFETGLAGWSLTGDQGVTPTVVSGPVHSGLAALSMGGTEPEGPSAGASLTTSVSQTLVLTGAWEPALSFWYQPVTNVTRGPLGAGDALNVILTVVTETISPTLPMPPDVHAALAVLPATPLSDVVTSTRTVTTVHLFTPSLDVEGWQHEWYRFGPLEMGFTGTVTIQFQLRKASDGSLTSLYLDEVSLGSTPGGPHKSYLPLVLKKP
jgi:hypothetical protein